LYLFKTGENRTKHGNGSQSLLKFAKVESTSNTNTNKTKKKKILINPETTKKNITINICTHNVRGITKQTKQNNIMEEMKEKGIDILGLSETKLTPLTAEYVGKNNPNYKCITSSGSNKHHGRGVAIIITKELEKYIAHITKIEGHIIAIHMLFKKNRMCIIQTYLPNNKDESNKYQRAIREIINRELKNKSKIIVMGDFNAVVNPWTDRFKEESSSLKWKPEAEIFNFLMDWEFVDIQSTWEEEKELSPTWSNKKAASRIDYIWTSPEIIIEDLHSFQNTVAEELANSDHTLLSIKLFKNNFITSTNQKPIRKKGTIKILDIKNSTNEHWEKYNDKVNREISRSNIEAIINKYRKDLMNGTVINLDTEGDDNTSTNKLNEIWQKLERLLITSAFSTLKTKKIRNTYPNNKQKRKRLSSEFKEYRNSTKLIKAINKTMSSKKKEDLIELNKLIEDFNNKKTMIWPIKQYDDMEKINEETWIAWRKDIREIVQVLKEESIRKENQETNKQIKKAIAQRCLNLKESPKKMISSLTDQYKQTIKIDRIIVKGEDGAEHITTDPSEVKTQVNKYYSQAFKKRSSRFQQMGKEWKEQYKPRDYIDPAWFENLSKQPSEIELDCVLKELPNSKAPGPSGITYEMIKNLGRRGKDILNKLFHICILKSNIPEGWKKSSIYPIPKKEGWEVRLHNTRPIVLMETIRKCFTKIITNRLSTACKDHQVLRGPNYAGLPGESTQEPIQLLNSICEEAREEKKELWILLQDTAKAFDTVNLEMLEKALQRIKIPTNITHLIIALFKDRQFRTITEFGLTDVITAGDGIDQGETISPLLWRIFYDPLLCKIQENNILGYKLECTWTPNVNTSNKRIIETRNAAIAYMDDTTWIARSKKNMQLILDDAREFYKANDSQINSLKSVLIVINGKGNQERLEIKAGLNKEVVKKIDNREFARFLGVWIGSTNTRKDAIFRIKEEIRKIANALKHKKTTERQTTYIINRVLIPRIEYRIQHCHIPENICDKLSVELRRAVRNKLGISNTTPNSTIHHKGIVGLKSIWEIQSESHITNLINRLNDTSPAGTATVIRLKQAQIINWEPVNILKEKIPDSFEYKDNLAASALKMAKDLNINFDNPDLEEVFQWKGGNFTIKGGIDDIALYRKSIPSMRRRNIMFIDQLIDAEQGIMLSWKLTRLTNSNTRKGPEPKWHKRLRSNITSNNSFILDPIWKSLPWLHLSNIRCSKASNDGRIKEWCCKLNDEDKITWGKIEKKNFTNVTIRHYNIRNTRPETAELTICNQKSCTVNHNDDTEDNCRGQQALEKECIMTADIREIVCPDFLNKPRGNNKAISIVMPSNVHTLERQIKESLIDLLDHNDNEINTLTIPKIVIENWENETINKLVSSEEHREQLTALLSLNIREAEGKNTPYEFYTDGSLNHRGTQECKMGAAWIQTLGPRPGSCFKTGLEDWPSASRAEATAIATALLTVPKEQEVTIYTDSQNCIDTYQRLSPANPKMTYKRWIKTNNWTVWSIIIKLIKERNILLKLVKVKAHANDPWNNKADLLAKEASSAPRIKWSSAKAYRIQTVPKWKEIPIDIAPRDFIKEINKVRQLKDWTSQNRIQEMFSDQIQNQEGFAWKQLWRKFKENSNKTSIKHNQKRAFWIKLMHNELPTLDKMATRRPDLYKDHNKCAVCQEKEENRDHLFQCEGLKDLLDQAWTNTLNKFESEMSRLIKDIQQRKKIEKEKKGSSHIHTDRTLQGDKTEKSKQLGKKAAEILNQEKYKTNNSWLCFTLGLLNENLIKEISMTIGKGRTSTTKIRSLLMSTSEKFRNLFRKEVWNYRCSKTIEIDTLRNISRKNKVPKKIRQAKKNIKPTTRRKTKENTRSHKNPTIEMIRGIEDKIFNWIKYGSKWLGII
jgi:ribonuclease HI/endonuclease/exonuclease/phosphatase family metal-dependent hydrolase